MMVYDSESALILNQQIVVVFDNFQSLEFH